MNTKIFSTVTPGVLQSHLVDPALWLVMASLSGALTIHIFWKHRIVLRSWLVASRLWCPEAALSLALASLMIFQAVRRRVEISHFLGANPVGVLIVTAFVCLLSGVVLTRRIKLPDDERRRSAVQDVIAIAIPACCAIAAGLFLALALLVLQLNLLSAF